MCILCEDAHEDPKMASGPLELELEVDVSRQMWGLGTGRTWTQDPLRVTRAPNC